MTKILWKVFISIVALIMFIPVQFFVMAGIVIVNTSKYVNDNYAAIKNERSILRIMSDYLDYLKYRVRDVYYDVF